MRHHAEHIARGVEHPGDAPLRSVDLLAVAEGHAAFALEPVERFAIGEVVAVMVRHWQTDHLSGLVARGKQRLVVFDHQRHRTAGEGELRVAHERAGQQTAFGQHLEAVAHAEHRHTAIGCGHHRTHDRAARRHRAATQVVAIGKAAGQGDEVELLGQVGIAMPHANCRGAGHLLKGNRHVPVAVRSGECDDRGAHQACSSFSIR